MQAVVHADDGHRQHKGGDRERAHDVGDRTLGHKTAEDEHAGERQARADQREYRQELLVETELIDHPPSDAGAGGGNSAKDEDDDGRADERGARVGLELARQLHY